MGEAVLHQSRQLAPIGLERRVLTRQFSVRPRLFPGRGRRLEHAAEQAFKWPLAEQDGAIRSERNEGRGPARGTFALLLAVGQRFRHAIGKTAALRPQRAEGTGRAPLRMPARSAGVRVSASALISAFASGSGVVTAKSRATTRSILPSTAVARFPKAIAAMAAAV